MISAGKQGYTVLNSKKKIEKKNEKKIKKKLKKNEKK